jgi:hypothetical protein
MLKQCQLRLLPLLLHRFQQLGLQRLSPLKLLTLQQCSPLHEQLSPLRSLHHQMAGRGSSSPMSLKMSLYSLRQAGLAHSSMPIATARQAAAARQVVHTVILKRAQTQDWWKFRLTSINRVPTSLSRMTLAELTLCFCSDARVAKRSSFFILGGLTGLAISAHMKVDGASVFNKDGDTVYATRERTVMNAVKAVCSHL